MAQDHVTNEELGAEVGIIKSRLDGLAQAVERYIAASEARQTSLEQRFNERGQFRWPLLFSGVAAVAVVVGGAFTILKQQTDLSVALALAPVIAQNQVSITDRADMRAAQSRNSDRIVDLEAQQVKQTERSTEVETQIADLHTIANLDREYQMAFMGSLWRQSFHQNLPYNGIQTQPRVLPSR